MVLHMLTKKEMSQITEHIFVGSFDDSFDAEVKAQVSHILNVASEIMVSDRADHVYMKKGVNDDDNNENIKDILDDCIQFIDDAVASEGKVLIHCWEGKSRSVCACLAYLCTRQHMSLDSALELVKLKRPEMDIFPVYLRQTTEYLDGGGEV